MLVGALVGGSPAASWRPSVPDGPMRVVVTAAGLALAILYFVR